MPGKKRKKKHKQASQRRKNSKPRKRRQPPETLISGGWINPYIHLQPHRERVKQEAAWVLKRELQREVNVEGVTFCDHQVVVVYVADGLSRRSRFFSYRKLPIWQLMAIAVIRRSRSLERMLRLEGVIEYERDRFKYATEMADAIWEAWKQRWVELRSANQDNSNP